MMKITFSRKVMKLLFSSLLIISLFSQSIVAHATTELPEELTALKKQLEDTLPSKAMTECKVSLVPIYDVEILSFNTWLDSHFKNASSTSSLVNTAISKYAEFKQKLQKTFALVNPVSSSTDIQVYNDQFSSYALCSAVIDSYLDLAKERMMQHIRSNVSQKKTMMLLEKYQNINTKLRDLNVKIAEMYSLFLTFKNKLPFFQQSNCL